MINIIAKLPSSIALDLLLHLKPDLVGNLKIYIRDLYPLILSNYYTLKVEEMIANGIMRLN